jgi:RimJ/RimL family protein N-acetyltransferase
MGQIQEIFHRLKDGGTVVIRTARETDAEAFLMLGKSIMSEEIYSLTQASELDLTVEQEQAWIKSNLNDESHLVIVAEKEGCIVGQLDFSNGHRKRNSHTGEFGMGVHKDHRGSGVGSWLIGALIEWARENPQIEKINLSVHQTNARAISMYQKHGFQIEGVRTKDLKYPENVYVDSILMGLHVKV